MDGMIQSMMMKRKMAPEKKSNNPKGQSDEDIRTRMVSQKINMSKKDQDDTTLDIKKKSKAHNAYLFIQQLMAVPLPEK